MNFERRKLLELLEVARSALRSGRGDARLLARVLLRLKRAKTASNSNNCGTGAGGFKPGNTCGKNRRRASAEYRRKRRRRRGKDARGRRNRAFRSWLPTEHQKAVSRQKIERRKLGKSIKKARKQLRKDQSKEIKKAVKDNASPQELQAIHERHVQERRKLAKKSVTDAKNLRKRHRRIEVQFSRDLRDKNRSIRAEWAGPGRKREFPRVRATPELLKEIKAAGSLGYKQAVVLIETEEGPTIVAAGGIDLDEAQKRLATKKGLLVAKDMFESHAEVTALFTAGSRRLTIKRGLVTLKMCTEKQHPESSCEYYLSEAAKAAGLELVLSKDRRSFEFVKVRSKKSWGMF